MPTLSVLTKAVLIVAALGLAACKNPGRYGDSGAGVNGTNGAGGVNGAGPGGVATSGIGDPSNPASVAYFNQTVGDRVLLKSERRYLHALPTCELRCQRTYLNS